MPEPIKINESALVPVLRSLVTKSIVFLGGLLVAHGLVPQAVIDKAVDPIVGVIVTTLAASYAAWRAKRTHDALVTTADAAPNTVAVVVPNNPSGGNVLPALAALLFVVPIGLSLTACAITSQSVHLAAPRALVLAQLSFKSMQQATLAAIKSGVLTGDAKNRAIDLVSRGQAFENAAYDKIRTNAPATVEIAGMADVIAELNDMGVVPGEN